MTEFFLNKKRIKQNLILSILFGGIFFLNLFSDFTSYRPLLYGLLFVVLLASTFYEEKYAYLRLTEDSIQQNEIFRKKNILWKDVKSIKDFAGDIKIVGLDKTITIPKANLGDADLQVLQNLLNERVIL